MKILIIGSNGLLGTEMVSILSHNPAYLVTAIDRPTIDITSEQLTERVVSQYSPDLIINAAGYTDVDGAESNYELCHAANVTGVLHLARTCRKLSARLIHISTDFIFDGLKGAPYTEDDLPTPINSYGQSKLEGEKVVRQNLSDYLIIRTAWLYGKNGKNFVNTIVGLSGSKKELTIVNDQKGCPTYTRDLATALGTVIEKDLTGIINITNSGSCTWYEFGREILRILNRGDVTVSPILSTELGRPAQRPADSALSTEKFERLSGSPLRSWRDALKEYLLCEYPATKSRCRCG